ncbi:MAG: hypothetical protein LBN94_02330 [Puniceicoccales bacterium]|nr:hypothetical protein [Puniceicoccales bacterium]
MRDSLNSRGVEEIKTDFPDFNILACRSVCRTFRSAVRIFSSTNRRDGVSSTPNKTFACPTVIRPDSK